MARRNVNQKEIAKNLNLSVATVSKALGDYADVNSGTREKVVNMASKLGYSHIKRLREVIEEDAGHKTALVGVLIMHRLHEWQPTSFFAGMSEKCAKLNVSLVLHYVNRENCRQILDPANQPPAMRDGQLCGLILVNRWPREIIQQLAARIPCVSIQFNIPGVNIDVIGIEETHAISMLMDHLYNLGHRKTGFFGSCSQVDWARSRLGAYVDSIYRLGLEYDHETVCNLSADYLEDKAFGIEPQIDYICRQMERGVRGWVCVNDWVGYLLCRGLLNKGIRIPRDVSVSGFDDSEDNTFGCPKLTSVTVPALRIGAEALRRLMVRVRHPSGPQLSVKLRCCLYEGLTTGPAGTV